ncbi:hypothetical protein FIBSPDRAFT_970676 [Athelia psychrophila]|uniref:Uncharacterized protein n=1 Tax=Athelia psychrophila TaxID=1759441 RepID=A0A167SK56_9AGAM|nr:hypothetical protein FIBSPDRAFT_970676 [Fibularhizoctonia sp. CBS 109695]
MPQIDDLDNPPTFNKHEWLGKNKIYSPKNLPYFVVDTCTAETLYSALEAS